MRGIAADDELGTLFLRQFVDLADTPGNRDHVDRRIAAAHANDLVGGNLQRALVEGFEEGDAGNAVGRIGVLQRQAAAGLAADRPQDRVVILFQLFDADVAADARTHLRVDVAHFQDAVDFVVEEFTRRAVTGDTVAEHAAELVVFV